jgi:hypothetical protein
MHKELTLSCLYPTASGKEVRTRKGMPQPTLLNAELQSCYFGMYISGIVLQLCDLLLQLLHQGRGLLAAVTNLHNLMFQATNTTRCASQRKACAPAAKKRPL